MGETGQDWTWAVMQLSGAYWIWIWGRSRPVRLGLAATLTLLFSSSSLFSAKLSGTTNHGSRVNLALVSLGTTTNSTILATARCTRLELKPFRLHGYWCGKRAEPFLPFVQSSTISKSVCASLASNTVGTAALGEAAPITFSEVLGKFVIESIKLSRSELNSSVVIGLASDSPCPCLACLPCRAPLFLC